MKYVVTFGEREIEVELDSMNNGHSQLIVDGDPVSADLRGAGGNSLYSMILDGRSYDVAVVRKEDVHQVTVRARQLDLLVESEQQRNARLLAGASGASRAHTVKSQMPGIVTRTLVREGEEVEAGTPLLILEAMKMENEVRAIHAGTIQRLLVKQGQTVNGGDDLVVIK